MDGGTVTTDSTISSSGDFWIADTGTGVTVTVTGGTVSSGAEFEIGRQTGSSGTLTASSNATVTVGTDFYVGDQGTATFTLQSGADLTAQELRMSYNDGGTNTSTATITGTGTTVTLSDTATALWIGRLETGDMTVSDNATITATNGRIEVATDGAEGDGSLTINSGADVTAEELWVAYNVASAQGDVTIDGSGSTLNITGSSEVHFGRKGQASLTISDNGDFDMNTATLVLSDLSDGDTVVNINTGGDLHVDALETDFSDLGTTTTITVDGSGSTFTIDGASTVGRQGTSIINVDNSAVMSIGGELRLSDLNGSGTVDVNGGTVSGAGSIDIEDGGTVMSSGSGTGTISVSLTDAGDLTTTGTGTLILSADNSSFTGDVLIDDTSTLTLNHSNALTDSITSLTLDGGTLNADVDLTLGDNITMTASSNVAAESGDTLTLNGAISGAFQLAKTGSGTVTLGGANTYTGNTVVSTGTLLLGASDRIDNSSDLVLGGGIFDTGGFNETLATLTLSGNSTIDLDSGNSAIVFSDSSAVSWSSGNILTLTNFDDGNDSIRFGTDANGLTSGQIAQIEILNPTGYSAGLYNASLDASGFLQVSSAVIPEPATWLGISLLTSLLGWRERRRLMRALRRRLP